MIAAIALLLAQAISSSSPQGPFSPSAFSAPDWTQPGMGTRAPFVSALAAPYFADNTGGTDATSAIQSCINTLTLCYLPPGTYSHSGLTLPSNAMLVGSGPSSILSYTGSGLAVSLPTGTSGAGISNLRVRMGTSVTATGIDLNASAAAVTRNWFDRVWIEPDAGFTITTGQVGINLRAAGGSALTTFNDFDRVRIIGLDKPVVICATNCNQNSFNMTHFEQFGSGATGIGYNVAGSNNTFVGATFSRGGSAATSLQGFSITGSYNLVIGTADLGTGQLYAVSTGTNNAIVGSDSSSVGGGTNSVASSFIWPGPSAGLSVPKIRPSSGSLTLDAAGGSAGFSVTTFLLSAAFSGLGTPSNGAILYCSDCTVANPCASGGSGAVAKRINGAWVCN